MAFADKYTAQFKDLSGDNITIQIQKDGSLSSDVIKLIDNPVVVSVPNNDLKSQIWGLGCKIFVRHKEDLSKYNDLFATAEREHYVVVKKGAIKLFEGFIMPQIYEQATMPVKHITIPASNQISGLKDYRTSIFDAENQFSTIYLIDLIKDILNSTGLELPIYIKNTLFSKLYSATYSLGTTCYDKLKVNRQIYIDQDEVMDGYSILEDILKITYSRLYYSNGRWIIDRLSDARKVNTYRRYPFSGSATTSTINHPNFDLGDELKIANSGHLEYEAGKKEYRVIIDFDKYDNLIDPYFQIIRPATLIPLVGVWILNDGADIVSRSYSSPNVTTGLRYERGTISEANWTFTTLSTSIFVDVGSDYSFTIGFIHDDLKNVLDATWYGDFRLRYKVGANWRVIKRDGDKLIADSTLYDAVSVFSSPVISTEAQITDIDIASRQLRVSETVFMEDVIATINSDLSNPDVVAFFLDIFPVRRNAVAQLVQKVGDVRVEQSTGLSNNVITGLLNTDFRGVLEKSLRIYDGDFINYKNTLFVVNSTGKEVRSRNWSDNNVNHEKKLQHILIHDLAQQYNTARHSIKVDLWLKDDPGTVVSMGSVFTYNSQLAGRKFIVTGYDFNVRMCTYRIYLQEHKDYDNFDIV